MPERRRWVILAVGTLAQASACTFVYGMSMLIPALRTTGLTLFTSSLLVSAPVAGLLMTLLLWGALADRHGERIVILTGIRRGRTRTPRRSCGARNRCARSVVGRGRGGRCIGVRCQRAHGDGLVPGDRARAGDGRAADRAADGCGAGCARPALVGSRPRGAPRAAVPGSPLCDFGAANGDTGRRPAAHRHCRRGARCALPLSRLAHAGARPPFEHVVGGAAVRGSRRSRSSISSTSGTGIRPSPGDSYSPSRSRAVWAGSRPACGRTASAAGCGRCASWRCPARC